MSVEETMDLSVDTCKDWIFVLSKVKKGNLVISLRKEREGPFARRNIKILL